MKALKLLALPLLLVNLAFAQNPQYYFAELDSITVLKNGAKLDLAWAGGTNLAEFSNIDLNLDGVDDLVVFERDGNRIIPFVQEGSTGQIKFRYAPEYKEAFPKLRDWALFIDYNGDNKADIFTHTSAGIQVYKNTSVIGAGLSFQYALSTPYIKTDYGNGNPVNLYVSSTDIPAVVDQDGDGDLDIITFSILGTYIELHKNMSQELYGNSDSLVYELGTDCFGDMTEDFSTNNVTLNTCSVPPNPCQRIGNFEEFVSHPKESGGAHSGSTVLSIELDGDGDKELILGDISFNNLIMVRNGGCAEFADMDSVISNYPDNGVKDVDLPVFPAAFQADINNDGKDDFLAAPAAMNVSLNYNCNWSYLNMGTQNSPVWQFHSLAFLQNEMIEHGQRAIPVLADLSGDGLKDLIVGNYGYYTTAGNYRSQLAYYENTGSATKPEFTLIDTNFANLAAISSLPLSLHPAFADLDADGDLDMIIGDSDGKLHRFKNIGTVSTPNFVLVEPEIGGIDVGSFATTALYDLAGNGMYDLVVGERDGNLNFIENNGTTGDPSFQSIGNSNFGNVDVKSNQINIGHSAPTFFQDQGITQLLVGNYSGQIYHYIDIDNNLGGNFTAVDSTLGDIFNGGFAVPAIHDLNANGNLDLLVGNTAGGVQYFHGTHATFSIEEEDIAKATIYPNPAKDLLQVDFPGLNGNLTVQIFDIHGKLVQAKSLTAGSSKSIDISSLSKGVYVIQLHSELHTEQHKLIKQ